LVQGGKLTTVVVSNNETSIRAQTNIAYTKDNILIMQYTNSAALKLNDLSVMS
jgi:hypothetical protein